MTFAVLALVGLVVLLNVIAWTYCVEAKKHHINSETLLEEIRHLLATRMSPGPDVAALDAAIEKLNNLG